MKRYELLLIGGSAGSLDVLLQLLPALSRGLDMAIVVVLHRKPGESMLAELLNGRMFFFLGFLNGKEHAAIKEAEEKESIELNNVYIAPADYHLLIEKDKTFSLDYSEKVHYSRPAIDVTFETAAEAYGPSVAALLLSGANSDGSEGLSKIRQSGGLTLVQDPSEAIVSYMPQQAIDRLEVDHIAGTKELIGIVNGLNG